MGEVRGRYGGDMGEIWGRYGGDVGEIWGRYGGDLAESSHMLRFAASSSFSMPSGSSSANWPSFHSLWFLVQLPAVSHSVAYGSKVLDIAASWE